MPILEQAQLALQQGAFSEAVEATELVLLLDAQNIDAMALKLMALHQLYAYAEVDDLAAAMRAAAPQDMRGYLLHIQALLMQGRYEDAKPLILRALQNEPRSPILKYYLMQLTQAEHPPQSPLRHKKVSIMAPSILNRSKYHDGNPYWLQLAHANIMRQSILRDLDWEIVIGVDQSVEPPDVLKALPGMRFVNAAPDAPRNQAAAMNAMVKAAAYETLAFFEEDDLWADNFLELALRYLDPFDFISANQLEVMPDGGVNDIWDYGNPNSWVMTRACWNKVGGMDERFVAKLDVEFIGRLNQTDCRRVFFYNSESATDFFTTNFAMPPKIVEWRDHRNNMLLILALSPPGSLMIPVGPQPLVSRLRHDDSLSNPNFIARNAVLQNQHKWEIDYFNYTYGEIWPF